MLKVNALQTTAWYGLAIGPYSQGSSPLILFLRWRRLQREILPFPFSVVWYSMCGDEGPFISYFPFHLTQPFPFGASISGFWVYPGEGGMPLPLVIVARLRRIYREPSDLALLDLIPLFSPYPAACVARQMTAGKFKRAWRLNIKAIVRADAKSLACLQAVCNLSDKAN